MSYYTQDQQWHQHSQTSNLAAAPNYNATQTNGNVPQNEQRSANPVLNQAVNNIINDLKANMDKDYFKTTCGLLNSIEVVVCLITFIIASNIKGYSFLTLLTGFSFWISFAFLVLGLFSIPSKVSQVPWIKAHLGFCGIAAALFLLEAIILLFFNGILSLIVLHLSALFGYHTYDKLKEYGRTIDENKQQSLNPQQTTNLTV